VRKQIYNQSLSEELTEFDYELLRSLQISPPARLKGRILNRLSGIDVKNYLSTPYAWIGLALFSSGAIMLWFWSSFLIQKLDF
jgi:hypothetical protein